MEQNSILKLKKYNQEGDLAHEYNPLRNIIDEDDQITDFRTDEIRADLNNPLNIECQPSYDGTVNLIINDDNNPPRIINSRFTVIEDNRYRIINRNQLHQTNLYNFGKVDSQTRLFRNINAIPRIDLNWLNYHGQLKGGNYTFYVKLADNDYNETDIVCESGIISVFKGTITIPNSISGTLSDERTDKSIQLSISNIDTSFSKVYLYYTRDTSDMNGFRITEACKIKRPYEIKSDSLSISVNGFEEIEQINVEELNIKYNLVTAVKTQAQVQNMLFFGNVQGVNLNYRDLQNISLYIKVGLRQSLEKENSLGYINEEYLSRKDDDLLQTEYYNPLNIYYRLGYWPGEIYRLGIVYIMTDDSLSPVFNLRGCKFDEIGDDIWNYDEDSAYKQLMDGNNMNYVPRDEFIEQGNYLDNTKGVFKNPDNFENIIVHPEYDVEGNEINKIHPGVYPLHYQIQIDSELQKQLKKRNVKGYFIVRQKRIPITLCQGFSLGTDRISFTPMLYDDSNPEEKVYVSESFLSKSNQSLTSDYLSKRITTQNKQSSGLISLDANVNPLLQSMFDGTQYTIQRVWNGNLKRSLRMFSLTNYKYAEFIQNFSKINTVFVNSDVPLKYVNNTGFSTRAGSSEEAKSIAFFGQRDYLKGHNRILRGVFCPFLGLTSSIQDNNIVNIRIQNYSSVFEKEYFKIRGADNSSFYAVSRRYELLENDKDHDIDVYRGDCYTNTVTIRLHRNFVDSDTPTNETIVDIDTWRKNYDGFTTTTAEKWLDINRADLNAVPIGTWITFKCLSNYNLGLRSEDRTNTDETAIMGSVRSFHPIASASTAVGVKVEESWLLNDGYSSTLGQRRNFSLPDVPYIKDIFDNRIMFSNVQVNDDFKNAYRIFQGLSFKDIDRQYGAIVKLIPWGVHLFCVFEHGLGIIPVNEKALMSTATGQSIHMYGFGVLQDQITLISPDFGSIWQESVIRTPVGIYGVDTYAKKIWRFSEEKGLELISDMKVQRFLNDNIELAEKDKYPTIALKNVKSHFNNYKGDVMFTFYNDDESALWHLCYNERLDRWITQYSWIPLYSENINNIFYSLDKKRAEILAYIFDNQHTNVGINLGTNKIGDKYIAQNEWQNKNENFVADISTVGYDFYDNFEYILNWMKSSYMDGDNEIFVDIPVDQNWIDDKNFYIDPFKLPSGFNKFYNFPRSGNVSGEDAQELFPTISSDGRFRISKDNVERLGFSATTIVDGISTTVYDLFPLKNIVKAILEIPKEVLIYNDNQLYYLKLNMSITPLTTIENDVVRGSTFRQHIGIILAYKNLLPKDRIKYDIILKNGFYVHGRAGIFDEIDYFDRNLLNNITPTKWYGKQEPFEFEFVVNNLTGFHKIFNDLVIISNNVEPKSLEFEIVGDIYDFNKAGIFWEDEWDTKLNQKPVSQKFENVEIVRDHVLEQYSLVVKQDIKNIKTYGRMKGNIHYKEDAWYIVIEPIKYKKYQKDEDLTSIENREYSSTRIRDKFLKVRVKYSGENLAIITALKTFMTLSYS